MTSGSLGHGLSAAVGMALDARMRGSPSITYVLLGDGELQEGLVWEGAMAAAKYALDTLVAIVDCNGLQSSGRVADIMPIEPLADKWRAFGWQVTAIDGHDARAIAGALRHRAPGRPSVVLARTVKGKGDPRMEDDNRWHQACPAADDAPVRPSAAAGRRRHASCRAAFGEAVLQLRREERDIAVVTSDTAASMGLEAFARDSPQAHVEVGIAEQNLLTVAAGLAANGRTVVAATYATFASMRALEQLRTFLAYPKLRVVVAAGLGGLSGGIEGVAHLALEDVGILRCVPDLVILNPADAIATRAMVRAAADHDGPVYLRLGRDDSPVLFEEPYAFAIGRGRIVREDGWTAALMTSGPMLADVLDAAASLRAKGVRCTVLEFPTLKPVDRDLILRVRRRAGHLFTIEEHAIIGGLGSAVADVLSDTSPAPVHRIGVEHRFLESGSPVELRERTGLTASAIAARVAGTCGIHAAQRERTADHVRGAD
jgi:transketolase